MLLVVADTCASLKKLVSACVQRNLALQSLRVLCDLLVAGGKDGRARGRRPKEADHSHIVVRGACVAHGSSVGGVSYGFYTGWLTPYWTNLSDAHAAVLAQLIFFFGAAWAAVLVPLLFGEQLQNLQEAAKRAEDTYAEIRSRMETTAAESEAQLKKIVRLQMMSVGHLLDEQLKFLETADEKDEFVDSRWDRASTRIDEAVAALHGNIQNSIRNAGIRRSNEWWDKLKAYGVLGEFHDDFKLLSHISRKAKQNLTIDDLRDSNNASRNIESFDPAVARQKVAPPANNSSAQAPIFVPPQLDPPADQLPQ